MNHKSILIAFTAFVVIGLLVFTFAGKTNVTGNAVISQGKCFELKSNSLEPRDVSFCCESIKASTRCIPYTKDLTRCSGSLEAVMDTTTIQACER